jgi:hypothetical protein
MNTVSVSLWLPISRPSFFNFTEGEWMERRVEGDLTWCSSKRIKKEDYVPLLLVGVLRRLLEVMPRSFGYAAFGLCEMRGDSSSRRRPVSVTLTLDLIAPSRRLGDFWSEANGELVDAGATMVTLFVSENGAYSFTAAYPEGGSRADVLKALVHHIRQVFGGNYVVHPLPAERTRRVDVGSMALKDYNGLADNPEPGRDPDADDDTVVTQPRGILTFSQLNILAEGMWNDTLSPAVFLEQRDFMTRFLKSEEAVDFLRSVADVIEALTTEVDGRTTMGQIVVLHHFLTVSSHGSLLKLKSALESVRRRLLDEMMGSMHRQTRLVQLRFATNSHERRPELAVSATESQLKGYAALVAAKFPLVMGVGETIRLAKDHLDWVVERDGRPVLGPGDTHAELQNQLTRLHGQIDHWDALLKDLGNNVDSLSRTIEHAWMEDLLYEEKQLRSDQEAMAEIERSRLSRPDAMNPSLSIFNLLQLVLGASALVLTVNNEAIKSVGQPGARYWELVVSLWPLWTVILAFFLLPLGRRYFRAQREKRGVQATYPYEFTFRLNEKLDPDKLKTHVGASAQYTLRAPALGGKVWVTNRGYGRVEHISPDSTVVKIRQVITYKMGLMKYGRFEVISEILIHKIARKTQHVLVQVRAFGESPAPLKDTQLIELLRVVLDKLLDEISDAEPDERTNIETLISESLYGQPSVDKVREVVTQETEDDDAEPPTRGDLVRVGER